MSPDDHVTAALPFDRDTIAAAKRENFPVAGWFIARDHRATVEAYYAFARTADDIADDPALPASQKLALLDRLDAGLKGTGNDPLSRHLRTTLDSRNIPLSCAADLLIAFRSDASCWPIQTLRDLDDYCRYSAAPVGRFLLALHGESEGAAESDALCAALQILNHIQDVRADFETLGRSYLPRDWIAHEHVPRDPRIRSDAIVLLLAHVDQLLAAAGALPMRLVSRRLSAQSAAILCLARRLAGRLRAGDPWSARIALRPIDWAAALVAGIARLIGAKRHG
ncbi:MAG: squalene synthase HpnC [Alphaproteobacteria bacterium]|nr:squalene synthase HpnC [Alphaproteobacteria bacterium]